MIPSTRLYPSTAPIPQVIPSPSTFNRAGAFVRPDDFLGSSRATTQTQAIAEAVCDKYGVGIEVTEQSSDRMGPCPARTAIWLDMAAMGDACDLLLFWLGHHIWLHIR